MRLPPTCRCTSWWGWTQRRRWTLSQERLTACSRWWWWCFWMVINHDYNHQFHKWNSWLLLTRKVCLRLFPIWWSWVQTYMWIYQDIGPSCFITLLCSSLHHDEYHDFRKMASKTTFHLQRLDLDEDGEVTVEEFLQACTQDKTIRWGHDINDK